MIGFTTTVLILAYASSYVLAKQVIIGIRNQEKYTGPIVIGSKNKHTCFDTKTQCSYWKNNGACERWPKRMNKWCKKTCGYCDGDCFDLSDKCSRWSRHHACSTHKERMHIRCKATCGFCELGLRFARDQPKCASSRYGCCWDNTKMIAPNNTGCPLCYDKLRFCNAFKNDCKMKNRKNKNLMLKWCPRTCNLCSSENENALKDYMTYWDQFIQDRSSKHRINDVSHQAIKEKSTKHSTIVVSNNT